MDLTVIKDGQVLEKKTIDKWGIYQRTREDGTTVFATDYDLSDGSTVSITMAPDMADDWQNDMAVIVRSWMREQGRAARRKEKEENGSETI